MNKLYIHNCWIYFKTNAKTYDEAMDHFLKVCADNEIDIYIEGAELRDGNGNEVEEDE